jgi:hypothetical protein
MERRMWAEFTMALSTGKDGYGTTGPQRMTGHQQHRLSGVRSGKTDQLWQRSHPFNELQQSDVSQPMEHSGRARLFLSL